MPEADDGTVSTNVLLQIAQILVLRLPLGACNQLLLNQLNSFLN